MHFSIKFIYKKERKNETVMEGKWVKGTFMLLQVIFLSEMIGSEETNELGNRWQLLDM